MNKIDQIENSLGKANSIQFFPTRDYKTEPPVIALIFDKENCDPVGYNLLLDNYKNSETSLVMFKNGNLLDISIVVKTNGDSINIKSLKYDQTQLADFLDKEEKDRKFAFVIGSMKLDYLEFFMTREPFSPIVLDKFEIK